jgi:mRNA-degrading endonuclease YafQ of YafQ-DinJ toxin-antitoxin module
VIPFVRNFDTIARFDQRSIKEALKTPIDLQRVMQKLTQLEKLYALLQKHKLKDQDDWKAILHTKIKPSADGFNADNIRDLIQILEELGPGHPMFEASLRQLERNLLSKR